MKAVLHTGLPTGWLPADAGIPWALIPIANRPLLEFHIEFLISLGIQEVVLLLDEGAYEIESYAGDGARWGVEISYGFLRPGHGPDEYLRRKQADWENGCCYLGGTDFLRWGTEPPAAPEPGTYCVWGEEGFPNGFICPDAESCIALLESRQPEAEQVPSQDLGWAPVPLRTPSEYYTLNMELASGEIRNYVTPGYELTEENSYIGYNVLTPPSCLLTPPVLIGNDVRLRPLSEVGPRAVIGNHVVIDSQTTVRDCVVLDGTYIGRNLEMEGKLLCGGVLIDPETGLVVDLEDPLLLDQKKRQWQWRDALQILIGKGVALALWVLGLPGFFLLYPLIRLTRAGRFNRSVVTDRLGRPLHLPVFSIQQTTPLVRFFTALSLDRWPAVGRVLRDRLYLCGHDAISPDTSREDINLEAYLPAAFTDEMLMSNPGRTQREIVRRWAVHQRSAWGDARLLGRMLCARLFGFFTLPEPRRYPYAGTDSAHPELSNT